MTGVVGSESSWEPAASVDRYTEGLLLYTESVHGDGVVVSLMGELDMASAPGLLRRVHELLEHPIRDLTLDLAALTFVDSSGIAAFNQARADADRHEVTFALAAVPKQARQVLELTNMDELLHIRGEGR